MGIVRPKASPCDIEELIYSLLSLKVCNVSKANAIDSFVEYKLIINN